MRWTVIGPNICESIKEDPGQTAGSLTRSFINHVVPDMIMCTVLIWYKFYFCTKTYIMGTIYNPKYWDR